MKLSPLHSPPLGIAWVTHIRVSNKSVKTVFILSICCISLDHSIPVMCSIFLMVCLILLEKIIQFNLIWILTFYWVMYCWDLILIHIFRRYLRGPLLSELSKYLNVQRLILSSQFKVCQLTLYISTHTEPPASLVSRLILREIFSGQDGNPPDRRLSHLWL